MMVKIFTSHQAPIDNQNNVIAVRLTGEETIASLPRLAEAYMPNARNGIAYLLHNASSCGWVLWAYPGDKS
jgi:hypothetical protein